MPQVIFLSVCDWANVGHTYAKSLRSIGVDAVAYAREPHPFCYPETDEPMPPLDQLRGEIDAADITILMHSELAIPLSAFSASARLGAFHGGTLYREMHDQINEHPFFQGMDVTLIQTRDLLGFGAPNEIWMLPAVDTHIIRPIYYQPGKTPRSFAHYPRDPLLKGTGVIHAVMAKCLVKPQFENCAYDYSHQRVPWPASIRRMGRADVYIESMQRRINGRPMGEWGVTALEAAALGCVVVTISESGKETHYLDAYGRTPRLELVTDEQGLEAVIDYWAGRGEEWLIEEQTQTRDWVERVHGLEATGHRLREVLL